MFFSPIIAKKMDHWGMGQDRVIAALKWTILRLGLFVELNGQCMRTAVIWLMPPLQSLEVHTEARRPLRALSRLEEVHVGVLFRVKDNLSLGELRTWLRREFQMEGSAPLSECLSETTCVPEETCFPADADRRQERPLTVGPWKIRTMADDLHLFRIWREPYIHVHT